MASSRSVRSAGPASAIFGPGSRGPAVAEIRDRLVRIGLLGADRGCPDLYDEAVEHAVRVFQQQRGLMVDGVVGGLTYRRLEEARWVLGDRVLAYRVGRPVSGEDVATLQRRLLQLGFALDRVDGIFGPATDAALRELQRSVGVTPDGTCGPDTLRALGRLARTMGGEGDQLGLREQGRLETLATGVADKVVVLDPGRDRRPSPVPAAGELTEAAVAPDLAARVEGRLAAIGVQVLLTSAGGGTDDAEVARAAFANAVGADLVLALRTDQVDSTRANGAASFYYGDGLFRIGSRMGAHAADLVQRELTARTDLRDCHTHPKSWDLLRLTKMPTVVVECGYLSSPHDAVRLRDPAFRDALAEGLAAAVVAFFAPAAADRPGRSSESSTDRDRAAP